MRTWWHKAWWPIMREAQRDPTKADREYIVRSMDEWDQAEKDFKRSEAELAYSMAHGIDAQTEVVECSVFGPGTLFRTIFKEPVIVGMNDVLETEWTKEGLQVTLNGGHVRSRTMVVCGDKYRAPNTLGYHDVAALKEDYATLEELYKDED